MMSHFAQARQGRGPRLGKAARPAFLLISAAAVAHSQYFYPRPAPVQTAPAEAVTPIRRIVEAHSEERITVKVVVKPGLEDTEERTVRLLRRMREIGRRVLREERGQ
jgi:hypothetical protein